MTEQETFDTVVKFNLELQQDVLSLHDKLSKAHELIRAITHPMHPGWTAIDHTSIINAVYGHYEAVRDAWSGHGEDND